MDNGDVDGDAGNGDCYGGRDDDNDGDGNAAD